MEKMNWIILSIAALISFSIMVTLITYVSKQGLSIPAILFGIFLVSGSAYGIQTYLSNGFNFNLTPTIGGQY